MTFLVSDLGRYQKNIHGTMWRICRYGSSHHEKEYRHASLNGRTWSRIVLGHYWQQRDHFHTSRRGCSI
jgi:hypothetical protein